MSIRNRLSLRARVALVVSVGVYGVAMAAEPQLEEVTVTARKRVENLQDVPLTITAFSSETIERENIRSVEDVARFTPGLNFDKGFAPQDTRISIRGLPVVRGKPPTGILLDGIDISSESISTAGGSSLVNLKLVDLEQIEVVEGPQSALYGRSAFAGAVVYTSKKPNLTTLEGNASVEGRTYGFEEGRAAVSLPIVNDVLAVRINAVASHFDGFWKNTITDHTIGGDNLGGGSIAIRFKPNDIADFTLRASYSDDRINSRPEYYVGGADGLVQQRPVPANAIGLRLGTPPGGAPLPASWPFARIGVIDTTGNSIRVSVDPLTGRDFDAGALKPFVLSLVGDVDLGFARLSNWTGFTHATSFGRADADFYGFAPAAVTLPTPGFAEASPAMFISDIRVNAKQMSEELRLGNDAGALHWAVGALYWGERYGSNNASLSVSPIGKPAGFSGARAYQILGQAPYAHNERDTDHESGYGTLSYDFMDKIEGSVEARYAHEKVDSVFGPALNLVYSPTTLAYVFGATPINPDPTYTTNMFTPRAVLKYKFDPDTNAYVSYARGEKPGGYLNVSVVTDTRLARYNPEKLDTFEVGVKSAWLDRRLRADAAFFYALNKDRLSQILVPDPTSPQGVANEAVNIGEVKIDGVEAEVTAKLTEHLTFEVAYSYIDARYTSSDAAQTSAFGVSGPDNCRVAFVGPQKVCITNTNGNQLDFSAKHSLNAALTYTAPINGEWNAIATIDGEYRSERPLDATNLYWLPGYATADLSVAVESARYKVTFFVTNLTDDLKPKTGQTTGDTYSFTPPQLAYTVYAPDKRQIGGRFDWKF